MGVHVRRGADHFHHKRRFQDILYSLFLFCLPGDDVHGDIEDLGDFEDRINVPAHGCRHVMGGAGFAPAVAEIPGPAVKRMRMLVSPKVKMGPLR